MGVNQSRTYRKVQQSLPFTHHYDRLSSSNSNSDHTQPLIPGNNEWMEELKVEFDAIITKKGSLERKNSNVEKRIGEIKASMSKMENKPPTPEETNTVEREIQELKNVITNLGPRVTPTREVHKKLIESLEREIRDMKAAVSKLEKNTNSIGVLEREIRDLKAAVAKLESRPPPPLRAPVPSQPESDKALKEEISSLKTRAMKLELDSLGSSMHLNQSKQDINKVEQKIAGLESKVTDLNRVVEQFKSTSFYVKATELENPAVMEQEIQGYLIVLIFLISVLIGYIL